MNQTDELVQGLTYVCDTMAKMQTIFHKHTQLQAKLCAQKPTINADTLFRYKWRLLHGILWLVAFAGMAAVAYNVRRLVKLLSVTVIPVILARFIDKRDGFEKKTTYIVTAIAAVFLANIGWQRNSRAVLLYTAVEIVEWFFILKIENHGIVAQNKRIAKDNQAVQAQMQELAAAYYQLEDELKQTTASWYPQDYYNTYAAEFFLRAVRNHRADSVKEMVNLFETTKEHQKLLEFQKEQARQEQLRRERQAQSMAQIQQDLISDLQFVNMLEFASNFLKGQSEVARDRDIREIKSSLQKMELNSHRY